MGTVMLDHDGVISDWVGTFYPWICSREGWEPSEWLEWSHYRNHEMHDHEFVSALREYASDGGFGNQPMLPGVSEAVRRLKLAGHDVHVVTHRPPEAEADTAWWMAEHLPEVDSLTFSAVKSVFKQFGDAPYFGLDDKVENVQEMLDSGVRAYLLTQPWNAHSNLPRVSTIEEFVLLT